MKLTETELELALALKSDELINTQAELDNERQYQVSMEHLWALDRELLSNLKEHSEKVEHERDEAINHLDSAKYSISVLEKRVLQATKQRDASLILNKFYQEDRKQRDRLIEAGEARIEELLGERDGIREAAWIEALDAAHQYTLMQYGMAFLKHPVDRERIIDMIGQRE